MSTLQSDAPDVGRTELLEALSDARRRRILSVLADRSGPTTELELAAAVVARERDAVAADVGEEVRRSHRQLRHVHLPKLAEVGLVEWDREEATVAATDHPALDDPGIAWVLEVEDEAWDELIEAVADDRRRTILGVLSSGSDRLARDDLAREVSNRESGGAPSPEAIDDVRNQLHHVHLPKLERAGAVEYDTSDGTITYQGLPERPNL